MNAKMTKTIVVSILAAPILFFSNATMSAQSEFLLLVGPVSKVTNNSLEMMGQVVILESTAAKESVKKMGPDSYIAVFGYLSRTGNLTATRIAVLDSQYIPGASSVLVSGVLKNSIDKNGQVLLGELTMDVTSSLYTGTESYSEGIYLCIGVQPNPDGIMLANSAGSFESFQNFSNFQNSYSGEFLASIENGTPFSIGGGGGYSIGGGGGYSIGGGDGYSIGGGDGFNDRWRR